VPRAQIKDEKTYRELRKQGESKEKSARIANASAGQGRRKVAARGGRSGTYQDWPYPAGADFIVLRDPDGNEFCVIDHPGQ